jgi:hypothetical protein
MHVARTVGGSENADLKSLFLRFSEGLADRVAGGAPRVHAARTTPVKNVGAQGPRTGRTPGLSLRSAAVGCQDRAQMGRFGVEFRVMTRWTRACGPTRTKPPYRVGKPRWPSAVGDFWSPRAGAANGTKPRRDAVRGCPREFCCGGVACGIVHARGRRRRRSRLSTIGTSTAPNAGSGTALANAAQSSGVTAGPAALSPNWAASRLKSWRLTTPS